MSDDTKLYTLQQSQQKLDEISSILRYKFGDKWKTFIFLCGLLLFFIVLLIIFGLDFSGNSFEEQLNHLKAFFIVLFLGIGFFCVWTSILPDDTNQIYGIIPFPTMNAIIPVDSTQCGTNPTLCDSNSGCKVCVDADGVNNYDCILIPKDKNNIYYLGTPLQAGKSYCLPKAEQLRSMLSQGGCGTYTGKIVWGRGADGVQKWNCECLYPSLYGDPNQGCLHQVACENGGHLVDQIDGKTIWDPTNMPASLVGVSPYEKLKDGSPRFRCQCVNGYYNLTEDPYVCHPNVCYSGSSAENTVFNTQTRQCECKPGDNLVKSNVSGFCYPIDNNCNPDPLTGGCRYGIDIFEKSSTQNFPILFMKDGKYYTSDIENGNSYLIDVTNDITRLNLDKTKIIDINNTILKDAFYAFPINPSSSFSGGPKGLDSALLSLINTDMTTRLNKIAYAAGVSSSTTGIARKCNSFFYKNGDNVPQCSNQLSKTGTESIPHFDNLNNVDCGKNSNGQPIGIVTVDIYNKDKGYNCVCNTSNSKLDGQTCIQCTPEGQTPPNLDDSKCCSGKTKISTDGPRSTSVCTAVPTRKDNESCNSDDDCIHGNCGRATAADGEQTICCPDGRQSKIYAGYSYCYSMPNESACFSNDMCASHNCNGFIGITKGKCV